MRYCGYASGWQAWVWRWRGHLDLCPALAWSASPVTLKPSVAARASAPRRWNGPAHHGRAQKIEIHALDRLRDGLEIQLAIAAFGGWRRDRVGGGPARKFIRQHHQFEFAPGNGETKAVSGYGWCENRALPGTGMSAPGGDLVHGQLILSMSPSNSIGQ